MNENVYTITFKNKERYNWVSLSSITKETIDGFIKYLYSLNRDINVLPYIPGGGPYLNPHLSRNDIPRGIAEDIKKKVPIDKLLSKYINHSGYDDSCFGIHFCEDLYEFYLSLGIKEEDARTAISAQYKEDEIKLHLMINRLRNNKKLKTFAEWKTNNGYYRNPYYSRWIFIYMFRNEFKKYMHDKGYRVEVEGGWVLNNKKREMALGLIDEEGNLF